MDTLFNNAFIALGACLMVGNIIYYLKFMAASSAILEWNRRLLGWRAVGLMLLVFFLIGYIVALFLDTPTIMAMVLFFGSIYVSVALMEMMELVQTQQQMMDNAVDDANDTEVKTGLYNLNGFSRNAAEVVRRHPEKAFMVVQWDLDEFKMFNDINGYQRGDDLLRDIGYETPRQIGCGVVFGHLNSDHFVLLAEQSEANAIEIHASIKSMLRELNGGTDLAFHMGISAVDDAENESIASVCDHALIALRTIKGQYQEPYAWYKPSMKNSILEERRLIAEMDNALSSGQFHVWFQPQVNYQTGKITGAEALVRWIHPERGVVSPGQFIPLFEKNGFITKLDHYVWERVCAFQRRWIDSGHEAYPLSINISRRDIYVDDLASTINALTKAYDLDPSLLHLEITESVYMASPEKMNRIVEALQHGGFTVEMDDFGSGYSSLNTLKDMRVDTIKLDMKFLQQTENSDRSGRIISAMIRMADWLDVATLAEGVETKEQADFLKSMGCYNMQGYYFFKPMPENAYWKLLEQPDVAQVDRHATRQYLEGSLDFMDSDAQTTLMFNSFTGNAMIADYHHGVLELLRVNDRLSEELTSSYENLELFRHNLLERLEPEQSAILVAAMEQAIEQSSESSCVVRVLPLRSEQEKQWLNLRMRVISSRGSSAVLYFSIQDITDHWKMEELEKELETIFRNVPAAIVTFEIDRVGTITYRYISDFVFELFHLDPENYRYSELRSMLDLGISQYMIDELIDDPDRNVHFFEQLIRRDSDGTHFWLQSEMILREEDDSMVVYASLTDATEHYDIEAQQYAMMRAMPGGFMRYSCDEKEEVSFISDGLLDLLGYTREEYAQVFGDKFSPMVYEEDRARVLGEIDTQIGDDGDWDTCKYRVLTKEGQLRWVYDAAYVTQDSNGRRWFNVVILDLSMQTDSDRWVSD